MTVSVHYISGAYMPPASQHNGQYAVDVGGIYVSYHHQRVVAEIEAERLTLAGLSAQIEARVKALLSVK